MASARTSRSRRSMISVTGRPSRGISSSKCRASSSAERGVETWPLPLRVDSKYRAVTRAKLSPTSSEASASSSARMSSIMPANLVCERAFLPLLIEQSVLANEVCELATRADAQFGENVGEMCADRARGDLKRATDFLVGLSRRDHSRDLDLAPGQAGGSACDRFWRRPESELAHLFPCAFQLHCRSDAREDVVRLSQLAHPLFTVANFDERARESSSDASRLRRKRQSLELLHGRLHQLDRPRWIVIAKPRQKPVACIRIGEPQSVVQPPSVTPHSREMAGGCGEVLSGQSRIANGRHQPLQRPNQVSGAVGDCQSGFADPDRLRRIALCEVVRRHPEVRR